MNNKYATTQVMTNQYNKLKSLKGILTKINLALITAFVFLTSLAVTPSKSDIASANGQWQYLIKRGDTKGVGGSMANPSCPFYVGYFSLDYRPAKKYKDGYWMEKSDIQLLKSSGENYVVSNNSYEVRGSYTPEEDNTKCDNPYTSTKGDKTPLRMLKVKNGGTNLEWYSDFSQGNSRGNAIWKVKANYNPSQDQIQGVLKAYVCSGQNIQSKKAPYISFDTRNCKLINTANFVAKRVDSIEQASGKPLFAKQASLTTWFKWLLYKIAPQVNTKQVKEIQAVANLNNPNKLDEKYIKPSLLAVLPAYSVGPAYEFQQNRCQGGGCVCANYTTNSGGTNTVCGRCVKTNCPQAGQPSDKPITQAELLDTSNPAPVYCGNCGGGRCSPDGTSCL